MSTALDLLAELHSAGIYLRAVPGGQLEYEGPEDQVSVEVIANLKRYKAELIRLLEWDEEEAYGLIRQAFIYLATRYVEGSDLSVLDPWEDRMNEAYSGMDMGALRLAVRGFVCAGIASFGG